MALNATQNEDPLSLTLFLCFQQPVRLSLLLLLRKVRSRDLASFHRSPVHDSAQPAHGPQHPWIDEVPVLIDRILPDPEPHSLDNSQHPGFLARGRPALKLRRRQQLPFDAENRLLDARSLDLRARGGRETAQGPFGGAVGRVYARGVGRLDVVLADDVDGAFLAGCEVAQRVLGVEEAAREADGEEGRVVVDDVGVGEGGEVRGGAWEDVSARIRGEETLEGPWLTVF